MRLSNENVFNLNHTDARLSAACTPTSNSVLIEMADGRKRGKSAFIYF